MSSRTPYVHRIARQLSTGGWRVAPAAWSMAERVARWPTDPVAEIAAGVVMPIDANDWISANIYRGFYERAERSVVARLLPPGGVAVDVGANRGLYTGIMARLVGPSGLVVAFEPNPRCAGQLAELVSSAHLDNVVVYRAAVAAAEGTARLQDVREGHSGLATLRPMPEDVGPRIDVATVRLDGVPELQARSVDLVKIDVEGYEEHVLEGARSMVADRRIGAVLMEVSPQLGSVAFVDDLLRDNAGDYEGFAVRERGAVRRHTALVPVAPGRARLDGQQYNMLVLRVDRRAPVEDLVVAEDR